jgi:transmembrane sensor
MNADQFDRLLTQWLENTISVEDVPRFLDALEQAEYQKILANRMDLEWEQTEIQQQPSIPQKAYVPRNLRRVMYRWAAAVIGVLLVSATYWWQIQKPAKNQTETMPVWNKGWVSQQARITLPDGSEVLVDTLNSELYLDEVGLKVKKLPNGTLEYVALDDPHSSNANWITKVENPVGGMPLKVALTDGTIVWLNAASTLSYPVHFTESNRVVNLIGEGFFEVTTDADRPFEVHSQGMDTRVLGTQFNVKSYLQEKQSEVTLIEGSVQVQNKHNGHTSILKPNQQVRLLADQELQLRQVEDMDYVLAWRSGLLHFEEADITEIMHVISRTYRVSIVYENQIPNRTFSGKFNRTTPLQEIIDILNKSDLNIQLKDQSIIIR